MENYSLKFDKFYAFYNWTVLHLTQFHGIDEILYVCIDFWEHVWIRKFPKHSQSSEEVWMLYMIWKRIFRFNSMEVWGDLTGLVTFDSMFIGQNWELWWIIWSFYSCFLFTASATLAYCHATSWFEWNK